MNKDKLLEIFRDTAIKCHIGFKHEGPWEECEWVECEDRRKMINEATPSAVTLTTLCEQRRNGRWNSPRQSDLQRKPKLNPRRAW